MQDEQDAPTLTEEEASAAAKAVTALFQRWELSDAEARDLLGKVSAETWTDWKEGRFGPVSPDLGARLSHLLGVHKALRLIFSGPACAPPSRGSAERTRRRGYHQRSRLSGGAAAARGTGEPDGAADRC